MAEEIGYVIDLPEKTALMLSLVRVEKRFCRKEVLAPVSAFPVVAAAARWHWAGLCRKFGRNPGAAGTHGLGKRMAHDLSRFGEGTLTARKRDVAEFTLTGHSAEATGQILGFSPGTARIHRRNIYARLRTDSQDELFSRFLDSLVDPG